MSCSPENANKAKSMGAGSGLTLPLGVYMVKLTELCQVCYGTDSHIVVPVEVATDTVEAEPPKKATKKAAPKKQETPVVEPPPAPAPAKKTHTAQFNPKYAAQWLVESNSEYGKVYKVSLKKDGTYACDCPKWKFAKAPKPDCKHIQEVKEGSPFVDEL